MFSFVTKVKDADEYKNLLPIDKSVECKKRDFDKSIKDILIGIDKRLLVICGPCSADNIEAVYEYAQKLSQIAQQLQDKMFFVMRAFSSKPRTNGDGYLGMFNQPYGKEIDINSGIYNCRKMFISCIKDASMPVADELLYPEYYDYFDDLVSYYVLGARSGENPKHRNVGSGIDLPLGIKNNTSGNLLSLAGGVHACMTPKEFLLKSNQVKTNGNMFAHAILRGYADKKNQFHINYDNNSIDEFNKYAMSFGVSRPAVIVDCSHANSKKIPQNQIEVAHEVIKNKHSLVKGIMLESYLFEGSKEEYGYSKTDSCLSIHDTKTLLNNLYNLL